MRQFLPLENVLKREISLSTFFILGSSVQNGEVESDTLTIDPQGSAATSEGVVERVSVLNVFSGRA